MIVEFRPVEGRESLNFLFADHHGLDDQVRLASPLAVFIEASCCREPRRTMTAVVRTTIRAGWSGTLDRHRHTALVLRV